MTGARLPNVVATSTLDIVPGLTLTVHVLDTGQRVIDAESVEAFIAWLDSGGELDEGAALRVAKVVHGVRVP